MLDTSGGRGEGLHARHKWWESRGTACYSRRKWWERRGTACQTQVVGEKRDCMLDTSGGKGEGLPARRKWWKGERLHLRRKWWERRGTACLTTFGGRGDGLFCMANHMVRRGGGGGRKARRTVQQYTGRSHAMLAYVLWSAYIANSSLKQAISFLQPQYFFIQKC